MRRYYRGGSLSLMTRRAVPLLVLVSILLLVAASGCRAKERREARLAADATATGQALAAQAEPTAAAVGPGAQTSPTDAVETRAATAAAPACPSGAPAGLSIETMASGGGERSYRLYVPASYDASAPLPLLLNFHGFGSSAAEQERYSGFIDVAEANGFVLVTPDGTNNPQRWYIYGRLEPGYVDDFAFVDALIDEVSASVCIDQSRIYAAGISNGGAMSSLLGCNVERIAAVAPVAGAPFSDASCAGDGSVPVIAFHGTADDVVPFDGGAGGRLGLPITPVRENMRDWAAHNGCDLTLQSERIAPDVVLERYELQRGRRRAALRHRRRRAHVAGVGSRHSHTGRHDAVDRRVGADLALLRRSVAVSGRDP